MNKLCERLIEKHLSKVIQDTTLEVCRKYFDQCFQEACDAFDPKNTTIGDCYKALERLAIKSVECRLSSLIEEVTSEMGIVKCSPTQNPFSQIAYGLWDEFLYYYDVKGYVENVIGNEWQVKEDQLKREGILDTEGDYIKKA